MNIGLIGSGGREHALCKKIYESKIIKKIICFPGNAGTAKLGTNIRVNILDFKKVLNLIKFYKIDLVVIGPEEPLVQILKFAVGILFCKHKSFINALEPSSFEANLFGPNTLILFFSRKFTIPFTKGSSGPTTTNLIL